MALLRSRVATHMASPAAVPPEQLCVHPETGAIMRSGSSTDFLASARGHHRYQELHAMMIPLDKPVRASLTNADHPVAIVGTVKQRCVVFCLASDGKDPIPVGSGNIKEARVRTLLFTNSRSNGKPKGLEVPKGIV